MQSTKIIRRLDDLGRVVIPKSMRKNLKIRTGDNLEFFVSEDGITLKKYSPFSGYFEVLVSAIKSLKKAIKRTVVVTDKEGLVYSTDKTLSAVVTYGYGYDAKVVIKNSDGINCDNVLLIKAIVADEMIGYIAVLGEQELSDSEVLAVDFCAQLLADFYGFGDKKY